MEDRNPIRSKRINYFVGLHDRLFLRRRLIKECGAGSEIPFKVLRHYMLSVLATSLSLYLFRKEQLALRIISGGMIFSISILNVHFRYERDLFETEALTNTDIGARYRARYS
jgi:hypothetical protein